MITVNQQAFNMLQNSNQVAIFVHVKPDGDCLGSASALKEALLTLGKKADIYCDDEVPTNFQFLPHINKVNQPELQTYDLAVALDASDLNRIGNYATLFQSVPKTLKIDHHKTQDNFAQVNVVELVSSTCFILYYYLTKLTQLNSNLAQALYAGISSDTGCFIHSNTGYLEHEITAELLKYDFNLEKTNYYLFKIRTVNQVMLAKLAYNSLQVLQNGKLAIMSLTQKDFAATGTNKKDTHGLSDVVTNIEGVKVGVVISEDKKGLFAISMRSVDDYDVSAMCESFGGGGHKHAAGCNIFGHLTTVVKKIEDEFLKQKF